MNATTQGYLGVSLTIAGRFPDAVKTLTAALAMVPGDASDNARLDLAPFGENDFATSLARCEAFRTATVENSENYRDANRL